MATIKWAVLLLFATSAGAAAPDVAAELRAVRTVNVRTSSPEQAVELGQKIDAIIPSLIPDPSEEADLIIEYSSSNTNQGTTWHASLFHLACQSPEFGVPPSRPVHGRCENNVFVHVDLDWMSGVVPAGASATEDFAYALRDAILGFAPSSAPVPTPVPALPVIPEGDFVLTGTPSVEIP